MATLEYLRSFTKQRICGHHGNARWRVRLTPRVMYMGTEPFPIYAFSAAYAAANEERVRTRKANLNKAIKNADMPRRQLRNKRAAAWRDNHCLLPRRQLRKIACKQTAAISAIASSTLSQLPTRQQTRCVHRVQAQCLFSAAYTAANFAGPIRCAHRYFSAAYTAANTSVIADIARMHFSAAYAAANVHANLSARQANFSAAYAAANYRAEFGQREVIFSAAYAAANNRRFNAPRPFVFSAAYAAANASFPLL